MPSPTPRELAEQIEGVRHIPRGLDEFFSGYGVMGLPFRSGHVLAMRHFPASSLGTGYTSVWHRDPTGAWEIYADTDPMKACPRYFGSELEAAGEAEIEVQWLGPHTMRLTMKQPSLEWLLELEPTLATRAMNGMGDMLTEGLWHNAGLLKAMSTVAGPMLGAGHVGLEGHTSNGQRFIANPRHIWAVAKSQATLNGEDLGELGPVHPQAHLGDFWIPQRGLFAIGQAFFEPLDPSRHRAMAARH